MPLDLSCRDLMILVHHVVNDEGDHDVHAHDYRGEVPRDEEETHVLRAHYNRVCLHLVEGR